MERCEVSDDKGAKILLQLSAQPMLLFVGSHQKIKECSHLQHREHDEVEPLHLLLILAIREDKLLEIDTAAINHFDHISAVIWHFLVIGDLSAVLFELTLEKHLGNQCFLRYLEAMSCFL